MAFGIFIITCLLIALIFCDDDTFKIALALVTFMVLILTIAFTVNQTEYDVTTGIVKEYQRGEIIEVINTQTLNNITVSDTTYVLQKFKYKLK